MSRTIGTLLLLVVLPIACASTPGVKQIAGKACVIVDALEKGCATLKYFDETGTPREITLNAHELNEVGIGLAKRKAASSASGSASASSSK